MIPPRSSAVGDTVQPGMVTDSGDLVILTSDNGPVVDDGYRDGAVKGLGGHRPAGPYRGGKYSKFEGGTRVPFVVRWPARVKPGTSKALLSQVDFVATFAALVGAPGWSFPCERLIYVEITSL